MELRDKVARAIYLAYAQHPEADWRAVDPRMKDGVWFPQADAAIATVQADTGWQDIATAEIEQYEQNEPVLVLLPDGQRLVAQYAPINGCGYAWFAQISNGNFCNEVYPTHCMPLPPPPFEGTKHG